VKIIISLPEKLKLPEDYEITSENDLIKTVI